MGGRLRLSNRLVIGEYHGSIKPGLTLALTSPAMLAEAKRTNGITNVTAYRAKDFTGTDVFPIGLSHRVVFAAEQNQIEQWNDLVYSGAHLQAFPNYTPPVDWLGHMSAETASYHTTTNIILANTAFTLRFFLYDANRTDEDSPVESFVASWGDDSEVPEGSLWNAMLNGSEFAIMRLSPAWTQEKEVELIDKLGIKEPTTEEQEAIEALRREIYLDYTKVSLSGDKSEQGGTFYEMTLIPERMGKISVYSGEKYVGEVTDTSIAKTRSIGTLWGESAIQLRRNGGQFLWQMGYPEFTASGSLTFPYKKVRADDYEVADPAFYKVIYDAPQGDDPEEPTTSITWSNPLVTGAWRYIHINFATADPRVTPFLYLASAYLPPDARDTSSDTDVWLDTAAMGYDPIQNVQTQFDGPERRGQHTVDILDVNGTTFGGEAADSQFHHDSCENRRCSLWVGGAAVLTDGIVKEVVPTGMAGATANAARGTITHPWSRATMVLCDQMLLAEEYELTEGQLIGDGLYLGDYVRRALRLIGTSEAQLAGIPSGSGPRLPCAALGEKWAMVCGSCTLADHLFQIVDRHGMGRKLYLSGSGVWKLNTGSGALAVIGGQSAAFVSGGPSVTSDTYPGRFVMQIPLEMPRITEDFYNSFTVIGANDSGARRDVATVDAEEEPDAPITGTYTVWESIVPYSNGGRSRLFIGRMKAMSPLSDDGLRTQSEVNWVARSLATKHCKPPQFIGFDTFYHYPLFVGDRISCDGIVCEVERISGADIAADRMSILARVVL